MKREYMTFVEVGEELGVNEEQTLWLTDLDTLNTFRVKALVLSSPDDDPELEILWSRTKRDLELKKNRPYGIKIIQRLDESFGPVSAKSQKISLGKRKGEILFTLIKERESKE